MKKFLAALAAATITLVGSLAVAQPVQAAVSDCPAPTSGMANICLFEDPPYQVGGTHGYFRRTADQVWAAPNGCFNLNTQYWGDGSGIVGDYASSLVINSDPGIQAPDGYIINFYEWVNCNPSARQFHVQFTSAQYVAYIPYLSNINNRHAPVVYQNGSNFNDTIMSMSVHVL